MKREEHRHTIVPRVEPLPKEPPKPCMRGVLDIELYNRTGEVKYIEPLAEFVPPENIEDDVEVDRMVKGRFRALNINKPKKEVLEKDLRSGMPIAEIANKYDCSVATVNNWIRSYALQGIKGKCKTEDVPPANDMDQSQAPVVMVQKFPTLADIEQFHTDGPVQKLPEVEMDEPLLGMTAEENMTDEEWEAQEGISFVDVTPEPKPETRENFEEVWQDVRSDLVTLERLYVAEAKKSFRERLRELLTEIVKEESR